MASATGKSKFDVFIDEKYRTLDAKVKWAVFAAALLVPALLFLLGVTDPMLRYRSRGTFQKQKEDE